MDIRAEEDRLFSIWASEYECAFVEDGCICPQEYLKQRVKVVLLLKDENTGHFDGIRRPLRDELANSPHYWWERVGRWLYLIQHPQKTWQDSSSIVNSSEACARVLRMSCIVNLKKTIGRGFVPNSTILEFVLRDKEKILQQLSFYQPDIIIAGGNGDEAVHLFDSPDRQELENGVGFWDISVKGHLCRLVDYCHPSVRSGNKIKGLIATELAKSIDTILELA